MTLKFNNIYIKNTSLVAGFLEKAGKYGSYFDKTYKDYYMDESLESSEVKMQEDSLKILLEKEKLTKEEIDLFIAGDLQNQINASSYAALKINCPFLGVYSACATTMESIIIGSMMLQHENINKVICTTSSHNLVAEKQFRNPVEYGAPKPVTATFTSTGAASILLSNEKTDVKITYGTIGKPIDFGQTDVNHMGAIMAPAAADTIFRHLKDTNRTVKDYDLILTGDLGIYGKKILEDYMKQEYKIDLKNHYNDCGAMLYNLEEQDEITAGGSGPVCSALINYGYIYEMLQQKKLKKVLLVTTGALFSPTYAYQKNSILGIAHATSWEVVE